MRRWITMAAMLAAGAARAQETVPLASGPAAPPPAATAAEEAGPVSLDEVVVTAQRRVESLQDTPVSVAAFNSDRIEQRGIEGMAGLASQVPSLTVEPFPTHNATLRIFIRGVGIFDAQLTQDPPVGVYLDGVYIARSVGLALDLAELERIEVLRGPQGTLYGRNTTGGAVGLITRRPQLGVFSMQHKAGVGSRELRSGRSSINLPLGDDAAVKLAWLGTRRAGYVENTGPGGDFGDRSEQALRLDARWLPVEWLTADYSYERADMDYVNYMFQSTRLPETNKGQAESFKPYAVEQSIHSAERLEQLSSGPPMEDSGTDISGHTLSLSTPLGAHELKYIGGWRELRDAEYADLGGGRGSLTYRLDSHEYDGPAADMANGGPTPLVIPTVTQEQWSHELQLSGTLFDGAVQYIGGLFWFEEEGNEDRHRLNHQLSTAISPDQVDELAAGFPLELDLVLGQLGIADLSFVDQARLVNFVDLNWDIDNEARAAYGQVTWTPEWLDRRLHLTVGYRHSRDERLAVKFRQSDTWVEFYANGVGASPPRPLSSAERFDNVEAQRSFRDNSFSYIAAFDVSERVNVYAKWSEAYKSGGFNVRDPHVSADSGAATPSTSDDNTYGFGFVEGFAPEYVDTAELGLKSEWFGRRLRANLALFDSDYRDMQINFLIPGTISDTKTRNAGKARMRGAELDLGWRAAENLTLSADYAYLDADVIEAIDRDGNNVAHLFPFQSAPRHSYVLAADWTALEASWGALRAYASYHFTDRRQGNIITEERRDLTSIEAYGLVNARLSAVGMKLGARGSFDLALWGRNLLDENYTLIAIDNVPQSDRAVVWGEPRSLGLELVYRHE